MTKRERFVICSYEVYEVRRKLPDEELRIRITIMLDPQELADLDELVASGSGKNRSRAAGAAIRAMKKQLDRDRVLDWQAQTRSGGDAHLLPGVVSNKGTLR